MKNEKEKDFLFILLLVGILISSVILSCININSISSGLSIITFFMVVSFKLGNYLYISNNEYKMPKESGFHKIIHLLGNIWIAGLFTFIIIAIVNLINKEIWGYIFAILFAYLVADVIVNVSIRGGGGIIQIPLLDRNKTQHKGHGYIVFIVVIVISTIVSGLFSNSITNFINQFTGVLAIIIPNLIMIILIYADFFLTFYRR